MIELEPSDRQRIKDVAIMFHATTITPADRLMGDEKMPWAGFQAYRVPEGWVRRGIDAGSKAE